MLPVMPHSLELAYALYLMHTAFPQIRYVKAADLAVQAGKKVSVHSSVVLFEARSLGLEI
jgi:hypothetical protein